MLLIPTIYNLKLLSANKKYYMTLIVCVKEKEIYFVNSTINVSYNAIRWFCKTLEKLPIMFLLSHQEMQTSKRIT